MWEPHPSQEKMVWILVIQKNRLLYGLAKVKFLFKINL